MSILACLLHYVDVFETFRKYGELEKGMTTHSSIPTWEIPWTQGPVRVQSTGSQRVRHDLVTKQDLSTTDEQSANPQAEV